MSNSILNDIGSYRKILEKEIIVKLTPSKYIEKVIIFYNDGNEFAITGNTINLTSPALVEGTKESLLMQLRSILYINSEGIFIKSKNRNISIDRVTNPELVKEINIVVNMVKLINEVNADVEKYLSGYC